MEELLDSPHTPASAAPWPTIIRYGLIGGGISIALGLISNITGLSTGSGGMMMSMVMGLLQFAIMIAIVVLAIRHHRDAKQGGFISIGQSILVGTGALVVAGILNGIFSVLYVTVIDPNFADEVINYTADMMSQWNLPEEEIDKAIAQTELQFTPSKMFLNSILYAAVGGLIVSAISGLIMKKG